MFFSAAHVNTANQFYYNNLLMQSSLPIHQEQLQAVHFPSRPMNHQANAERGSRPSTMSLKSDQSIIDESLNQDPIII